MLNSAGFTRLNICQIKDMFKNYYWCYFSIFQRPLNCITLNRFVYCLSECRNYNDVVYSFTCTLLNAFRLFRFPHGRTPLFTLNLHFHKYSTISTLPICLFKKNLNWGSEYRYFTLSMLKRWFRWYLGRDINPQYKSHHS